MSARPRLLDLFCGGGGAAMGYHRAGFDVVGVDCAPQPRYPFLFIREDALDLLELGAEWIADTFAAIHASPPCQRYSVTASLHDVEYPDLVARVRGLLDATGLPWVIENVVGAPLTNCVTLCGSSFGLGVRRHRRFETNFTVWNPPVCRHDLQPEPIDVTGGGPTKPGRTRTSGGVSRKPRNLAEAGAAMGVDWMTRAELNEAVPPAFTEFVGSALALAVLAGVQ